MEARRGIGSSMSCKNCAAVSAVADLSLARNGGDKHSRTNTPKSERPLFFGRRQDHHYHRAMPFVGQRDRGNGDCAERRRFSPCRLRPLGMMPGWLASTPKDFLGRDFLTMGVSLGNAPLLNVQADGSFKLVPVLHELASVKARAA